MIERANQLLELIRTEKAGPEHYDELLQLMHADTSPELIAHIQSYFSRHPKHVPESVPSSGSAAWQQVLHHVIEADKPLRTPVRPLRTWLRIAAAAVIVVTAGSIYYLQPRTPDTGGTTAVVRTTPIEPGKEGATLTLEDGTVVALDSLGNGMIAGANAMLQNGQLAYAPDGKSTAWNTITTPKARQFRIVLPDGTTVWLNAATSLRFPTAFPGGERKVALQGEAYFEVAKNTKQPFRVNLGDTASVEVLGTDFNINAYTDEPAVRTTLLSGSVRVRQKQEAIQLQPGQQAVMQKQLSVDKNANIEGVTAWKSGKFYFEGVSLEEFMRQVTRWYDIEVEYKGSTPQMRLKGKPGRDLDLQDLLDGLAELGIRYKMEGRKLIIL